jgi:type I restriction enzyme S subunit
MSAIIDYRGKSPQKTQHGIPLITAKIVKNGRIETPDEFIAPEDYDDWMRRGIPQRNDIVMTTEAPLGEIAQLDGQKVALAQRLITLRGKPNLLDNKFLKFAMQSEFVQNQLNARATGTTVFGIRQSELRKILLPLPTLGEQSSIGICLGSLDDKIELNRRMNKTLEAIAHAIFKRLFIYYRASLAAKGRKSADGWTEKDLTEVFEINPTRKLEKGVIARYVDMANMPTSSARVLDSIPREFTSGMRFSNGDTLIARITPCLENGKTAFVDFLHEGEVAWGSTEFIVLRPKPPLPPEYAYFLARSDEFRAFAISNMSGTSGRQRVPADCFQNFDIAVPPASIAAEFGKLAKSFFLKMKNNDEQSQTLSNLRDALLPKLISGEIRLKEAAKIVEAHA